MAMRMGLFGKRRIPTMQDPEFGTIRFETGYNQIPAGRFHMMGNFSCSTGPLPPSGRGGGKQNGRRRTALFTGAMGMAAGLIAVVLLFYAVGGISYLVHDNRIDLPGDAFVTAMFVLIGAICGMVSIRWIRAAARLWAVAGKRKSE
jgi:hypothetical protein